VGIVLVSHSAELVSGLRALLAELAPPEVPVVGAGGTDDGRIGTSYRLVLDAVRQADAGGGVVVLADLGSSVLTARTVLEDEELTQARLVDAPFVEGAVAAVVTASTGAALPEVARAATDARSIPKFQD
jgi:PTS hybrid protein